MAMSATARAEEHLPRPEINTTPLIDVMLVLLIMFIMIIPVASHEVPVDLPQAGPAIDRPVHRLDLDAAGRTYWNGAPIGIAALREQLAAAAADPALPTLHVNTHPETRYERFGETLAEIRRAGITRLGFVGNERFQSAIGAR
jgi:biopolymer transport protein ExbD